jgi:hypothetical protein
MVNFRIMLPVGGIGSKTLATFRLTAQPLMGRFSFGWWVAYC